MFNKILLFLTLILIIETKFLDNLDRTFSTGDDKVLEVNITMPDEDYSKVLEYVQVGLEDIENGTVKDCKTKSATVTIADNNDVKVFPDSTFKLGGNFARTFSKPGFNINLSSEYNDRKSFRLRTDVNDKSYLRQKLIIDIANRVGLPSIQSTFVKLTINGNYYGLYKLMDTLKPVNIKRLYNTETKKSELELYQCKNDGFTFTLDTADHCTNDSSDNENDTEEFIKFVTDVNKATTIEDLEKIMNVDVFLKYLAIDWIIGSFDHFLVLGHNFYFYKNEINNKWDIIYYDYDNTLGQGLGSWAWYNGKNEGITDFSKVSFKQFSNDQKILDIAVNNDDTRFKKNLKEVLTYGFNPVLLNEHINDLKSLISPYVEKDFIPINEDGELPGRVNKKGFPMISSYELYQMNSEYETTEYIEIDPEYVPGIKAWIESSFENACDQYGFDKEQILKDAVTLTPTSFFTKIKNGQSPYDDDDNNNSSNDINKKEECWSEEQGYSCCQGCNILLVEEGQQKWGFENNKWCGIVESVCQQQEEICQNSEYGCCNTCNQYYMDITGRYGYEKRKWCILKSTC
ncbi:hypothetical protein BCR32DRAFT_296340 [Anaeromyces robustus]|uniref:CBM10 domain-containing protein n=1 Tax=Anaeromyces robustus TaxID=1754192 RepID=A0A1Y1WSM7_9FUNG|nr:hypothetical protein BCR32DRAFT_296340 [Anaeromyces robustus]|eukprot:ORX76298.1 hypothetical protein BCR32DRAFT_296340 [Anaeromyces robustus]